LKREGRRERKEKEIGGGQKSSSQRDILTLVRLAALIPERGRRKTGDNSYVSFHPSEKKKGGKKEKEGHNG